MSCFSWLVNIRELCKDRLAAIEPGLELSKYNFTVPAAEWQIPCHSLNHFWGYHKCLFSHLGSTLLPRNVSRQKYHMIKCLSTLIALKNISKQQREGYQSLSSSVYYNCYWESSIGECASSIVLLLDSKFLGSASDCSTKTIWNNERGIVW